MKAIPYDGIAYHLATALFNEGDPINFNAILCRTPQELYTALANDLETEIQVSLGID